MTIEEFANQAGYESAEKMKAQLNEYRSMSVMDVDEEQLADVSAIRIDHDLPIENRTAALLKEIRNPYCFRYNNMVVKVSFAGKRSLDDCIAGCTSLK